MMLSRYLLCALSAASSIFSLTIPAAQTPLLSIPTSQDQTKPKHITPNHEGTAVILAFKRYGEAQEQTVQITLGQPLKGSVLHTHPFSGLQRDVSSLAVIALRDPYASAPLPSADLAQVRCRITPVFSVEEDRAARAVGRESGARPAWPAFGAGDGIVILDRAESRWFLAGRRIESVECW